MSKKIIFISNLDLQEEPTVENRLLPYIKQSLNAGFKVTLYSRDKVPLNTISDMKFTHKCYPFENIRPDNFVLRALYEYNDTKALLKKINKEDSDVFMLTIPSMFLLFNSRILKRKKLYLDVRDLTWHYLPDVTLAQKIIKNTFEWLASRCFNNFFSIAVTNPTESRYFKMKGINAKLVPNGISQLQFNELSIIKPKIKQENKKIVSYIGKVGIAQNLDILIEVAIKMPEITFNIIGYGPYYDELKEKIELAAINNVVLFGNVKWLDVIEHYKSSDILYAQLTANFSGAMPSKLYQYLCSSRYVIYGGLGQAKETLHQFSNNKVINPDSPDEIFDAITDYFSSPQDLIGYKDNVGKIERNFIRECSVNDIVKSF